MQARICLQCVSSRSCLLLAGRFFGKQQQESDEQQRHVYWLFTVYENKMSHVFNKTANITGDWRFSSCQSKLKKSLSMTGNPIKKAQRWVCFFLWVVLKKAASTYTRRQAISPILNGHILILLNFFKNVFFWSKITECKKQRFSLCGRSSQDEGLLKVGRD